MKRIYQGLTHPVVAGLLFLLPFVTFTGYLLAYLLDVPWFDDFESIPYFLQNFVDADNWTDRWQALLRPNNEHRVLYARLIVYFYYLLTGTISFQNLILIGNASLLVIIFLFYRSMQRAGLRWWYLLPVPFLTFHPQNYLLTFTALYTLQYLAIIMIALSAMYQLAKNTATGCILAVIIACFGTFSMGNGMLIWAAGLVVLFYQKQWVRAGSWLLFGIAAVYLYFYGYPVRQGNHEGFIYLFKHPFQVLRGFFVYTGSLADIVPFWPIWVRSVLPMAVGIIFIGLLVVWMWRLLFLDKKEAATHWNGFLLGSATFLVINMAIVALFRIRFEFGMVLWSTYRTYALVLAVVIYLVFIGSRSEEDRQWWLPILLAGSLGINLISYLTWLPEAVERQKTLAALAFSQSHSQVGLGGNRSSFLADFIEKLLIDIKKRGWYNFPEPIIAPDEKQLLGMIDDNRTEPLFLRVENTIGFMTVSNRLGTVPLKFDDSIYLIVKSDRFTYLLYGAKHRNSLSHLIRPSSGFTASIPKAMIQPGRYRLGLYEVSSEGNRIRYSDQFIQIE